MDTEWHSQRSSSNYTPDPVRTTDGSGRGTRTYGTQQATERSITTYWRQLDTIIHWSPRSCATSTPSPALAFERSVGRLLTNIIQDTWSDDAPRTVYTVVNKSGRHCDNGAHIHMWHDLMLCLARGSVFMFVVN